MECNGILFKLFLFITDIGILFLNLFSLYKGLLWGKRMRRSVDLRNKSQQTHFDVDPKLLEKKLNFVYKKNPNQKFPVDCSRIGHGPVPSTSHPNKLQLERGLFNQSYKPGQACFCDLCKRQLACK